MSAHAMAQVGQTLSSAEVQRILPQRFPLLMVDRVLDWEPHGSLRALRNVTANDPVLAAHFPDHPVMPGALLIEGIAQAALLLAHLSGTSSGTPLLGSAKAKFLRPVVPGDRLVYEVALVKRLGAGSYYCGSASVDGEIVAQCDLTVAVVPSHVEQ